MNFEWIFLPKKSISSLCRVLELFTFVLLVLVTIRYEHSQGGEGRVRASSTNMSVQAKLNGRFICEGVKKKP